MCLCSGRDPHSDKDEGSLDAGRVGLAVHDDRPAEPGDDADGDRADQRRLEDPCARNGHAERDALTRNQGTLYTTSTYSHSHTTPTLDQLATRPTRQSLLLDHPLPATLQHYHTAQSSSHLDF